MINEKYRNGMFGSSKFTDVSDMVGTIIEGAFFGRERPANDVFPQDMTGVTFSYCNLDNVHVPEGNILDNCKNRFYLVQADGYDWLIDKDTLQPIEPLDMESALAEGRNTDPTQIVAPE